MFNKPFRQRKLIRPGPGNIDKAMITGPCLEFRWSKAVTEQTTKKVNRPPTPLPQLIKDHSRIVSSIPLGRVSTGLTSRAIRKSPRQVLNSSNKRQTVASAQNMPFVSMNPSNDQYSIPVRPLLLNYSQLHRSNQQLVKHRASQHRLSIDKLSSISTNTSKCSFTSSPSMTSTPLPSLNEEVHLPTNNLVRLRTPQLRLLNISDKYINEAKELYFDATSRVFVPRAVAMQTMQVS